LDSLTYVVRLTYVIITKILAGYARLNKVKLGSRLS